MNAREAFNEMMHRQVKTRIVRQEAEIREQLIKQIRDALQDADAYSGRSDLFTYMAEVAVDALSDFAREQRKATGSRHL
jgi:hypothetical protein